MADIEEKLWVEKYRPQTLEQCILPSKTRQIVQGFIDSGEIPNLIFSGKAGMGKTTLAKVIAKQMDFDLLFINGSLENGIDILRNKIAGFASSVSLTGNKHLVLIDEADYLSVQCQPGLRAFMEQFSKNTRFIFTMNYENKFIEPLRSRCTTINFDIPPEEKKAILINVLKRIFSILKAEKIEFDPKAVKDLVDRFFPDIRKCINELQTYSSSGKIDKAIMVAINHNNFTPLIDALKQKNFNDMRKWVAENVDLGYEDIFGYLFRNYQQFLVPESGPQMILTLAQYQYQAAFAVDQELNTAACMTDIMANCEFK